MSEGKIIAHRREDRPEVLYLVFSNPKAMNALTTEMQIDFIEKLKQAREDKSVRCVVLRGDGNKAFSSGGAMQSLEQLTDEEDCAAMYQRGCEIREVIETYDKPIIAAVSGYCVGGGFEIAMCCDMLYASDDAKFSLPESKLGLVPGWGGAIRLPRKLTVNRAKEMILLGEMMDAKEAYIFGIVNKVFPKAHIFEDVDAIVDRLLAVAPLAIRGVKAIVSHAIVDGNIDAAHEVEKKLSIYLMGTEDFREAVTAFGEKRTPEFKGK
jgi:enoyl-CoA hydratase/carnithine racemase